MNVIFADKLSATCFHHAVMQESQAGKTYLQGWLLRFFSGGWCDHQDDLPEDKPIKDLWQYQQGCQGILYVGAHTTGMTRHPDDPGTLLAQEFSWAVYAAPVDNYGQLEFPLGHYLMAVNMLVNGGLINHGTGLEPDWASHT